VNIIPLPKYIAKTRDNDFGFNDLGMRLVAVLIIGPDT
jgi:hypothetical protein